MVAPQDFHRLDECRTTDALRLIAERYGTKLANEIAAALVRGDRASAVVWPNY